MSVMSDVDIRKELETGSSPGALRRLVIEPWVEACLTPIGYDLRVGDTAFSKKRKPWAGRITIGPASPLEVENDDTVVIHTRERVQLSKELGGLVVPKVSIGARALFHIAASVDPGWGTESPGAEPQSLRIHLHNYSGRSIWLSFETPLCTLILFEMKSPAQKSHGRETERAAERREQEAQAVPLRRALYAKRVLVASMGVTALFATTLGLNAWGKTSPQVVSVLGAIGTLGGVVGSLVAYFGWFGGKRGPS